MLIIGIILIVLGAILGIGILETIGIILAVIGAILLILSWTPGPFNGRRFY